jgi:hypothetical protein
MRVLAAAFEDEAAAQSVLDELRRRYRLLPGDASIAPMGTDDPSESRTLLAGRFDDDAVPVISDIVANHGGQIVSDVDESWTRSPGAHERMEIEIGAGAETPPG